MTGMGAVIAMRRGRTKPSAVMVGLVENEARHDPFAVSPSGIVTVDIGPIESLADIDFRPLHGLMVFVSDFTGNARRHRTLGSLVAAVEPSQLVMPVWKGDRLTVHRRFAGPPAHTESFTV